MLGLSRLRSENYISSLVCAECSQPLTTTYEFFNDFCESCISPEIQAKKFCFSCKPSSCKNCNSSLSSISVSCSVLKSFYLVFCPNHKDQVCDYYLDPYFIPVCQECKDVDSELKLLKINYKNLENQFKALTEKYFEYLSSERKAKLIPVSISEMLKALNWLTQLEIGPSCSQHKGRPGVYIDSSEEILNFYCEDCKKGSFELIAEAQSQIKSKTIKAAKKAENPYLNMLLLKLLKGVMMNSKSINFTSLLFLEYQNLTQKENPGPLRCVVCLKKLSVGSRRGFIAKCKHLICFTCCFNSNLTCCVDNLEIEPYEVIKLEIPQFWCHYCHKIDDNSKVFKQPCTHLVCDEHKHLDYCLQCGFSHSFWPSPRLSESASITSLVGFVSAHCKLHKQKLAYYSIYLQRFGCSKCDLRLSQQPPGPATGIIEITPEFVSESIKKQLERFHPSYQGESDVSINLLKYYKYISVLSLQKQLALLNILKVLGRIPSQFQTFCESQTFYIFRPQLCNYHLQKFREFKGKIKAFLTLTPDEDLVLTGFSTLSPAQFFNSSVSVYKVPNRILLAVFDKEKREVEKLELRFYFEAETENKDEIVKVKFMQEVYAKEKYFYEFCFEFDEGVSWIYTKTFERIATCFDLEKPLNRIDEEGVTFLDARFGGFVYGVELAVVSYILKSH